MTCLHFGVWGCFKSQGIIEESKLKEATNLSVLCHGIIPPAAGLSSSSAFVCASAAAALTAFNLQDQMERVCNYSFFLVSYYVRREKEREEREKEILRIQQLQRI